MAKAPKKKAKAKATVVVQPERDLVAEVVAKHRRPRRKAKPEPMFNDTGSWSIVAVGAAIVVLFLLWAWFAR